MKLSLSRKFVSLLIILLAVASVPLSAQTSATGLVSAPEVSGPETTSPKILPPEYGTSSHVDYLIGAMEFIPRSNAGLPLTINGGSGALYVAGTAGVPYDAAAHLPTGASVTGIEIQGCKNSASAQMDAVIAQCNNNACTILGTVVTSGTATSCGYFSNLAVTPFTIDNYFSTYLVEIDLTDTSNSISGVRIYYKLQISPDPTFATFADVPVGSLYHRFVEALVAAGITGGCGGTPPNYCPDAPVTRGQIAVFLSAALGLHFPD